MMNTTLEQLRGLKLNGMAAGLQDQLTQAGMTAMSFEERLALLVDREVYFRNDKRQTRLLRGCYELAPGVKGSAAFGSMSMANTTKCSPASTSGMRSKSRLRRLNLANQAKLRSTTQRFGSSTKPFFASGSLTTCNSTPFCAASLLACSPV